ncbi:glycoside hydrolase, partial [Trichophaea hybrida]
ASSAISLLLSSLDPDTKTFSGIGWWQSANAYTTIISYDLHTSSTNYRNSIGAALLALISLGDPDQRDSQGLRNVFNDDDLWWTLACLDAFKAYGNSEFLKEAKRLWSWVDSTSVIRQTGIAPDMGGIQRDHVVSDQCELENGVYWTIKTNEININSITTGLFMQVSARLYEIEKNQEYLHAAEKAGEWLRRHTVDGNVELVDQDRVNGETCAVIPGAYTYNTGVFIAALTTLYKCTNDNSYLQEAEEAAAAAMETTIWTDGKGMITESRGATSNNDGIGFRSILLRALTNLYTTPSTSKDTKKEIEGFINVNYNMLYNHARKGDAYDVNWFGPFTQESTYGQFSAVDLLVAGM